MISSILSLITGVFSGSSGILKWIFFGILIGTISHLLYQNYRLGEYNKHLETANGILDKNNDLLRNEFTEQSKDFDSFRKFYDSLQEQLVEWKKQYADQERSYQDAQKQITELQSENTNIKYLLDTSVDCELWLRLFPDTSKCVSAEPHGNSPDTSNIIGEILRGGTARAHN